MSAPPAHRVPTFGVPRLGLFAALTCLTAVSSPAIYYGTSAEGLSYLVALVAVPAVAAVGVARSGHRNPRREDRPVTARHRLSFLLAGAALPAALAVDIPYNRAFNEDDWLSIVSVVYGLLLVLGLLAAGVLRRLTSTRAVFAVLGVVTAVPIGAFLVVAGGSVGLVLAAPPLLIGAAVAYPPVLSREE